MNPQAFLDYRSRANGSERFYRHPLGGITYTDGVKILAESCGAYWLIDLIASYQPYPKVKAEPFQVWTLSPVSENEALALATDGDKGDGPVVLAKQDIAYTDFPRDLMPLRLFLENGTLMLPEER